MPGAQLQVLLKAVPRSSRLVGEHLTDRLDVAWPQPERTQRGPS